MKPEPRSIPSAPDRLAVPGMLALHLALALYLCANLSLWLDEAYTLGTTERGLGWAFTRALHFEMQAPLYFVAIAALRMLDDSLFVARLPSALMVAAGLLVVTRIWRRLSPTHPGWVLAPLALHPLVLYAASEARLYGGLFLASAALTLAWLDGFGPEASRRHGSRGLFVAIAVLGLYTQYFTAILLAAGGGTILLRRDSEMLRRYGIAMLIVAAACLPVAWWAPAQVVAHDHGPPESLGAFELARFAYVRAAAFLLPAPPGEGDLFVRRARDAMLLAGVVATTVGLLRPAVRRAVNTTDRAALGLAALSLGGFVVAVDLLDSRAQVGARHMMIAFPPVVLATLRAVELAGGRRALAAASVVLAVFAGLTSVRRYGSGVKHGAWNRVAAYIEEREIQGEPIVLFHAASVLPFSYYYAGPNPLVPVPARPSETRWYLPDFRVASADQIEAAVEAAAPGHGTLWLVTDGVTGWMGVDFNADAMEDFAKRYELIGERAFHHSLVRRLRRRPTR